LVRGEGSGWEGEEGEGGKREGEKERGGPTAKGDN